MLHLKSEEAIDYIGRLSGSIKNLIEQEFKNSIRYGYTPPTPASFRYLNLLLIRYLDLIKYYQDHGLGEAGVYITKSGFPSVPSLTADIRAIYENLYQPQFNLEERVREDDKTAGAAYAFFRMSLSLYGEFLYNQSNIKREMYEKAFFSDFLEGKNELNNFGGKLDGKFYLEEKDGFFVLSETFEVPGKDWLKFADMRHPDCHDVLFINEFIREQILFSKKEEEYRNRIKAKYLDPSVYGVSNNPILILITQGTKGFSSEFRGWGTLRSQVKENFKKDFIMGPGNIHVSGINDGLHIYNWEDRGFFIELLKAFSEGSFPPTNEKSNPKIIFDIYKAGRDYANQSDPRYHFHDKTYDKIVDEYVRRNIR